MFSIRIPLFSCLLLLALPAVAKTNVACVGDSITFGYTIPQRETNNYPFFLQQMLGDDFEVRNFGNSGKTAGDYPSQKPRGRFYGDTKEHQNAVDFKADIYVCNLGINDTGTWWDARLFTQGYNDLIAQWRGGRKNVKLFMWTKLAPDFRGPIGQKAYPGNVFTPDFRFPLADNGTAAKRPEAEKLLEDIAQRNKAVVMDAFTPLRNHPDFYSGDGLHPNAAGAKRLAQLTCSALYRDQPWKQTPPRINVDVKGQTVTLANAGKHALVLDAGVLASAAAESKKPLFRFGAGSSLGPGETITIRFQADSDSNDFGGVMSTRATCKGGVRFIAAPTQREAFRKWENAARTWAPGKP